MSLTIFRNLNLGILCLLVTCLGTHARAQASKKPTTPVTPPVAAPTTPTAPEVKSPAPALDDTAPILEDNGNDADDEEEDPYADEEQEQRNPKQVNGVLGSVRIGPAVALAIPHILEFGIDGKYRRRLGFGAMIGSFKLKSGSVNLAISSFDLRSRYHLFDSAMFVGGNLGKQTIKVSSSVAIASQATSATVDATASSNYFTPHIGWQSEFDSGLTLGFELGVQFVFGASVDSSVKVDDPSKEAAVLGTSQFRDAAAEVDDKVSTWAKKPLPYITLLRLGWLF